MSSLPPLDDHAGSPSRAARGAGQALPKRGLTPTLLAAMGVAAGLSACSGGAGPSSFQTQDDFAVSSISVLQGAPWQINRPILITFNEPIDFSTVSLNTINISDNQGNAATGAFLQPSLGDGSVDANTVQFQPSCPTVSDFSDAGLKPGGIEYRLNVLGSTAGGVTIRSADGDALEEGALVTFTTPDSLDPLSLFLDTVPGPPAVILRGAAGTPTDTVEATYLELGGDPTDRLYFELDSDTQFGVLPAGFEVPLNKYSETGSQVAALIYLNQPVVASEANINSSRVGFEYLNPSGNWEEVASQVSLVENCTESGAVVRVEPLGLLPQGSQLRMNVRQGFQDLTGDLTPADSTRFANMTTVQVENPDLMDPRSDSDEVLESFAQGGSAVDSLEDVSSAFGVPRADWADGKLQASFDFGGTGGPGGNFDWFLTAGESIVISTTSATIVGGPDGTPTTTQTVINGVVDVRNLYVPVGARLIFVGPNTATILASGFVRVEGEISVRGSDNAGVGTLDTTNLPEVGAAGNAGGGNGGTGSFLTSQSTPRGGTGSGAFNSPDRGGQGGETSYAPGQPVIGRRGAGGGGGSFGEDYYFNHTADTDLPLVRCQVVVGLDAEPGGGGGDTGLGAISQSVPAMGGAIGPDPFLDDNEDNNFFGTLLTDNGDLILGELNQVWAGAGGGGGGDSVKSATFPLTPFSIKGDEKGAGGGAGGGGLRILAIGSIIVEPLGRIVADGGDGGGGENTSFFNRVAGGSGGGSGGHIVLSSAAFVDVRGDAVDSGAWYSDNPDMSIHNPRALSAVGGQGGAGNNNKGGAKETGPTTWRCDSIPVDWVEGPTPDVPPAGQNCYDNLPDKALLGGPTQGVGGDGGPGIIQIHVDDPVMNLRFTGIDNLGTDMWGGVPDMDNPGQVLNNIDVSRASTPPPFGWTKPFLPTDDFIPFFGRFSVAQSDWIPLGLARVVIDDMTGLPMNGQVNFRFAGIDTDDLGATPGEVQRSGSQVQQLPALIGPDPLNTTNTPPFLDNGGLTCVFDGTGLEDIYKGNSRLTRLFSIELTDSADPTNPSRFEIISSEYDQDGDRLICTIDVTNDDMFDFVGTAGGTVSASLIRHDFRLTTNGIQDNYPVDTRVSIQFDAAVKDPLGNPLEEGAFSVINPVTNGEPTADISLLNDPNPVPPPDPSSPFMGWDFVRFRVTFDLNASSSPGGVNLNTPRPSLDFVRLPFLFSDM